MSAIKEKLSKCKKKDPSTTEDEEEKAESKPDLVL